MRTAAGIAFFLLACALIFAMAWLDYRFWRLGHPGAPTWIFFFK